MVLWREQNIKDLKRDITAKIIVTQNTTDF